MEGSLALSEAQGKVLGRLDAAIQEIAAGFDSFVAAAEACDSGGVPAPIVQAKAMELQSLIMGKMMGGLGG